MPVPPPVYTHDWEYGCMPVEENDIPPDSYQRTYDLAMEAISGGLPPALR